jgi:FkbM family methyltransferase
MLEVGARVVAFEPNPRVLPELRARCGRNPRWTEVATAIGHVPGIARFFDRSWPGLAGLHEDWGGGPATATHYVPIITLDAAVAAFQLPYYCKIDVEGWEYEVLQGLSHSIPLLSFEFHLSDREVEKTNACLHRLESFGAAAVNLTRGDENTFHYDEWVPLSEFRSTFPGDLATALGDTPYGDIWVRRA